MHQVGVEPVLGHPQAALERVDRAGKTGVGVPLSPPATPDRTARDGLPGTAGSSPKARTSTVIRLASARLRYSTCTPAPP